MAVAFWHANSTNSASVPERRTRRLPDASQKAKPNLIPGTVPTIASCRSSTDLMKWLCPRMKFVASGLTIVTVSTCISDLALCRQEHSGRGGFRQQTVSVHHISPDGDRLDHKSSLVRIGDAYLCISCTRMDIHSAGQR